MNNLYNTLNPLLTLFIFAFGLCIGSFLNVCIYRLPRSRSIVLPNSFCPKCLNSIRFYDNIPLLSYIILKGKCRFCKEKISLRYPMVELMSALMALCVFLRYGATFEAVIYYTLISALLVITFIDLDFQIIPDVISLPGIPLGFLCSFFLPLKFTYSLLGILLGGGSLLIVAWLYEIIAKKGGGDIKLLAMIGAFLGPKGVIFTIFISSVVGSLTGIIFMFYMKKNMKLAVPFGPFLSIGALAYIFFGPELIRWYFNILR